MTDSVLSDEHVGRRVIHGGVQRVLGFAVANLLTAGSAVILLRYLGLRSFGRYGVVLAIVGLVYGISDLGLTVTATRELTLCETEEERRELLADILGMRVTVTTVGVLGGIAFALVAGYDMELVIGVAVAGLGVLIQSTQAAILLPLGIEMRNGMIAVNQIITQAALLIGYAILAALGSGLAPFFAMQIAAGIVLMAFVPVAMERRQLVAPRWRPARIRSLALTALPFAAASVLGILYIRLLVIMMSLLSSSADQIGYYVTSTRVMELVGGLPFLVVSVVLPVVSVAARDDHDRLVYMTARTAQVMVLFGALIALVIWCLAGSILRVFGGGAYGSAGPILQVQGFAAITIFLSVSWQPALIGLNRLRLLAVALGLGVAGLIVAGLILIPAEHAMGAAEAAVVGDAVLCIALYVAIRVASPGRWIDLPRAALTGVATAAAILVGVVTGLPAVPRVVVVVAVFSLLAVALRLIPSELTDAARAALRRIRPAARAM